MVINGDHLIALAPICDMIGSKDGAPGGTSYGLGEAGYDIRIKQEIRFINIDGQRAVYVSRDGVTGYGDFSRGRFALASAIEEFDMPGTLTAIVHDKSTWARRGLSVFNTVIEPGWKGHLTLELVYHGEGELIIPAESGIAQVMFHQVVTPAYYEGKYQHQEDCPVPARDTV